MGISRDMLKNDNSRDWNKGYIWGTITMFMLAGIPHVADRFSNRFPTAIEPGYANLNRVRLEATDLNDNRFYEAVLDYKDGQFRYMLTEGPDGGLLLKKYSLEPATLPKIKLED